MAFKFKGGDIVRHVRTKNLYEIKALPDLLRIESTGEPAYAYLGKSDRLVWVRSQAQMEDGRFVLVTPAENVDRHI